MRISEKQSDTNQKDTIIYKYNDNDSVSYTYKLPILDKFTYYFDENDRIIPSNKYDYKNEQHSSREIYQVICEEYEYNQEGKIVEIREGKFEVMDNKSIGRMLELESEISFRYYPNGNLKSEQFTNEIYTYTKEWSEDGNQYVQKFRSKFERGERVYIFSCLNGKISKIESMMFPYSNYPTGNKSENTITELIYNDNHLISKIEYTDLLSKNKLTYSFEYKYDAQKNWIEKTIFINGKSKFIEKRELIYFND